MLNTRCCTRTCLSNPNSFNNAYRKASSAASSCLRSDFFAISRRDRGRCPTTKMSLKFVFLDLLLSAVFTLAFQYEVQNECEPTRIQCQCGEESYFELPVPMCPKIDLKTGVETCQICNWRQFLSRDPCSNFFFCETCSPGLTVCLTCPEERHGKYCHLKKKTSEQIDLHRLDFGKNDSTGCLRDAMENNYPCFISSMPGIIACELQCTGENQNGNTTILECDTTTGEWLRKSDLECETEQVYFKPKRRKKCLLGNLRGGLPVIGNIFGRSRFRPAFPSFRAGRQPEQQTACPNLLQSTGLKLTGSCINAKPGDECNFECDDGYLLTGPPTVICGQSGKWVPNPAICTRLVNTCPDLRGTTYVVVSGDCEDAEPGQVCSFSCAPGYNLVGPPSTRCGDNGKWEPGIATCQGHLENMLD